ncbi:MAG: ketoacyl-ACP synthase III [Paludibacteraceae bacterium]|nr:ketoacyl-ACP synthase III [Paludibacteraceae bacterium]MBR1515299.1 ketoacyl-ACP synthase III [Paludibacteraceae bacterium]
MKKAFINDIAYYLPEKVLTNEQIAKEFPEWSADKVASKVGITERHISAPDETATDMAYKAALKLFDQGIDRSIVDFVLLCTQSGDYFLPSSACLLQDRLGLSTHSGALDFNLGCSGYEYGLAIAKGLIVSGVAENILLLTSETYTKYIHPQDKGNRTIFGDGASASLISTDGFAEIGEIVVGTDGSGAENLIVKSLGARHKTMLNDLRIDNEEGLISGDYLYMHGGNVFNFTANVVPPMVEELLQKSHLKQEDVDLWIFHQANKYMINYLRKLLDIENEKFYIYMEFVGNTVSSTIPIAMVEARKEGRLRGNVLLAGFGVGLSWGGVMLRINQE